MRVLYFDCFSGISGDMTLGALLDLGLEHSSFLNELNKLNVGGYSIEINKAVKNGISGTDVTVILEEEDEKQDHGSEHKHNASEHDHADSHSARNLKDIESIIDASSLKPRVKAMSVKIFREIARAEAKVHGKDINQIHFHEVGAIDSIVDIVGSCICIEMLGVERIYASELHDGKGFVKCAHGVIPVPVPAVMEMLCNSNIPLISEDTPFELVTPTGMGIIKTTCSGFGRMPSLQIERTGYGMGKRETGRLNALRAVIGTLYQQDALEDISILETNIDNMSPEILGYTMEKLFESGALDVYYTPICMKKSRPAVTLTVLCRCVDEKKLSDMIFRETSTLGVRLSRSSRYTMSRELVKVNTQFGDVRVKVASMGDIMKFAPEYEDCRNIAIKTGLPINKIYEIVNEKYRQEGSSVAIQ